MKEVKEHTKVWNKKAINNIVAYTQGVVVHIYPLDSSVVGVEFFDDKGNTIGVENVLIKNLVERKKFLVALPSFKGSKGFCHITVLVSATDKDDAFLVAKRLRPNDNIGDIKEVDY